MLRVRAFSEVKRRMELRRGMRYPGQLSLISALLQLDVYYGSARSAPTLSRRTLAHITHGYAAVRAIDDFVKGNISRHASVGMREYASI